MEEILNSLVVVNVKFYVPWKQVAGAILLAMLTAALCICAMRNNTFASERGKAVTEIYSPENRSEFGIEITSFLQELKLMQEEERRACMNQMLTDFAKDAEKNGENAGAKVNAALGTTAGTISGNAAAKDGSAEGSVSGKDRFGKTEAKTDRKNMTATASAEEDAGKTGGMAEIAKDAASGENGKINDTTEETSANASRIELELYGNGGTPECRRDTCERSSFDIEKYEEPERLGKVFDGWYLDSECKMPFDALAEDVKSLKLYAGWKEFTGFISNDKGHIIGYTDAAKVVGDHLFVLPTHKNCTGIEKSAVKGLETEIDEIYIPTNITYIETELFDSLPNLMYIQVEHGNPNYYSKDGRLYKKNGELIAEPRGLE